MLTHGISGKMKQGLKGAILAPYIKNNRKTKQQGQLLLNNTIAHGIKVYRLITDFNLVISKWLQLAKAIKSNRMTE